MGNKNLHLAKTNKNDEFFTRREDIENELQHYAIKGIVYCNCDDYRVSEFVNYFKDNFKRLGIKKLIATNFDNGKGTFKYEYDGIEKITPLKQNGDFRSPECIEILQEADIVVTNPPFSLFREYIAQLIEYNKKFIILGNNNAVINKEIFPLIKNNKLWLGYNSNKTLEFRVPDDYKFSREDDNGKYGKVPAISWFTNLETKKRTEDLLLFRTYNAKDYPKYDNYDAINVDKVKDIPMDYYGVIGVPITFLDSYNPEQFEIIWQASGNTRASAPKNILEILGYNKNEYDRGGCGVINNQRIYSRILIKRKQNNADNT